MDSDSATKKFFHQKFHLETCLTLKKHVDRTLHEMDEILQTMEAISLEEKKLHPRYDVILSSNQFVRKVFAMVKQRVDGMIQSEVVKRRTTVDSSSPSSR